MPPAVVDVGQAVLALFFGELAGDVVAQELGKAQDRIQRRTQLVRHVREEFGFEAADFRDLGVRGFQLAQVGLQLLVEAPVVDRDRRLVGNDLEDGDVELGEGVDSLARDGHGADDPLRGRERLHHQRAGGAALVEDLESRIEGGVGDVEGLELLDRVAEDAVAQHEVGDVRHLVFVRIGGAGGQLTAALIEEKDGGGVELHHL